MPDEAALSPLSEAERERLRWVDPMDDRLHRLQFLIYRDEQFTPTNEEARFLLGRIRELHRAGAHALASLDAAEKERDELREALLDELLPLAQNAERLANNKNLAAPEVYRAASNVTMWLRAALSRLGEGGEE